MYHPRSQHEPWSRGWTPCPRFQSRSAGLPQGQSADKCSWLSTDLSTDARGFLQRDTPWSWWAPTTLHRHGSQTGSPSWKGSHVHRLLIGTYHTWRRPSMAPNTRTVAADGLAPDRERLLTSPALKSVWNTTVEPCPPAASCTSRV